MRAFDACEPFEVEYRLRRRDGEYRWVLDRGVPRYSPEGEFLGYAGGCIDIDERKRAESELARRHEPRLSGVRVLVVEEDEEARARTVELLNTAGAQARGVANGTEALDPLEKWRPDVLISDPARDEEGYLFLRSLRRKAAEGCARLAKPAEPLALLAMVARLSQPVGT